MKRTFWVLAILLGMVIFTETHSRLYRWIAGPLHALAHVTALFFIGWGAAQFASQLASPFGHLAIIGAIIFAGGWIVGSLLGYLVQRSGLSLGLDRMLGSVFGLVRGAVIAGFAVMLGQAAKLDSESWWKRSTLMPAGIEMAGILRSYVETGRQMVDAAVEET